MSFDAFYSSKKWIKFSQSLKLQRQNENGQIICELCGQPITKKYDCIAHHKIELNDANVGNADIAFNPDNIMLIHFGCHNKLHKRAESIKTGFRRREVYLVYGSPCSGKTTWVKEHADADDLILDIDKLWEAVCLSDRYNKPDRLKQNVFGLRDCMIEQIAKRKGKWQAAYIVGGYPLNTDRERLCQLTGARPVFINESKDVCLSRACEKWKPFVEKWFGDYVE